MAAERRTVEYILEQVAGAGSVAAKPMFGEYGLYCDGKMIGIIGNEKLFIKLTNGGRSFLKGAEEIRRIPEPGHVC